MEISVFKKIHLPKDKEDKKIMSFYSSKPHLPEIIECNDISSLTKVITNYGWSPSIFSSYRSKSNFRYCDFLVLDIDSDLTIEESLNRVSKHNLTCICLPTTSHSVELNKFRLIFPLDVRITNEKTFQYNINKLYLIFPEADSQCRESARFYFPCQFSDEGFMYNGLLYHVEAPRFDPNAFVKKPNKEVQLDNKNIIDSIYGTETPPDCVVKFLNEGSEGLDGEWVCTLNAFVFSLAIKGLQEQQIYDIVSNIAPDELDERDLSTFERAYNDAQGVSDE